MIGLQRHDCFVQGKPRPCFDCTQQPPKRSVALTHTHALLLFLLLYKRPHRPSSLTIFITNTESTPSIICVRTYIYVL